MADSVEELVRPPRNPARAPQGVEDLVMGMTVDPIIEAGRALKGQLTDQEAQNFALEAAMGLIPMGRGVLKPKGIRAYHGSPHDFDRFDMSKIGTGEGAQAYGHGLYFAEAEPVARAYQPRGLIYDNGNLEHRYLLDWVHDYQKSGMTPAEARDAAVEGLRKSAAWRKSSNDSSFEMYERAADNLAKLDASKLRQPGRMYEVNINAHPDQFLDWDKPFLKQPKPIQQTLMDMGAIARSRAIPAEGEPLLPLKSHATGRSAYESLTLKQGKTPEYTSDALREAGIPGIKYLDQGSRTAGEGSRNYVVFDDKLIDIVKKYGWAAVAADLGLEAGSQAMIPVDHDPYKQPQPKTIPVDHDPFAK